MNKKEILLFAAFIAVAYCLGFVAGKNHERVRWEYAMPGDATHVITYDTVTYYDITPRDSVVVRYETHVLPLAPMAADSAAIAVVRGDTSEYVPADSIAVSIPITQKVYADSTYTAYVSGFNPQLDSIFVYLPTHTYVYTPAREKARRWGIGPQVGVGWGRGGLTPYVGIGISYNIFTF